MKDLGTMRYRNIRERVGTGIAIEKQIVNVIRQVVEKSGYKIIPPTAQQDMRQKIDGVITKGDISHTIQVKFRQTGDDILVEVMRPATPDKINNKTCDGRDMVGMADWYAVLDKSGKKIYWIKTSVLKDKILDTLERKKQELTSSFVCREDGIEMKLTADPHDGVLKLVAFLNPYKVAKCILDANIDLR